MGDASITVDEITAEISAYLDIPDYFEAGWRTTRDIAEAKGISMGKADKMLNKLAAAGKFEKLKDPSNRAWWRVKRP